MRRLFVQRQTDNTLFSPEPKDYAAYFPFNFCPVAPLPCGMHRMRQVYYGRNFQFVARNRITVLRIDLDGTKHFNHSLVPFRIFHVRRLSQILLFLFDFQRGYEEFFAQRILY